MLATERPWFWLTVCAAGVFALGYTAAQGVVMFVCAIPFAGLVIVFGGLEAARLNRIVCDSAITAAFDFAEKARSMDPIT